MNSNMDNFLSTLTHDDNEGSSRPCYHSVKQVEYSDNTNDLAKEQDNNEPTTTLNQRRQTKVLLVSLIESLCKTYGGSPETTRKMFYNICTTLQSLGFIDSEFHDEVASIRFTYHKAFEHIFYAAAQNITTGNQPKLLLSTEEQQDYINKHLSDQSINFSLNHIQHSRYQTDFIEEGMLGRGGFGSAWKVRNKLDDVQYAIKKIRLFDEESSHEKILREIKNLARLEHHNVVRYYSSWLEYANYIDHNNKEEEEISWLSSRDNSHSDESSIFNGQDPTFDDNIKSTTIQEDEMSFISFGNNSKEEQDNNVYSSSSDSTIKRKSSKKGGFILYIQMQLCPSTLHEYLVYRNQNADLYFDEQQNINLFVQILEGAAYIHQEGLIHRDLKPSNIFLSTATNNLLDYRSRHGYNSEDNSLVPKIGDFGLAANVLHNSINNDFNNHSTSLDDQSSSSTSTHSNSVIELFTTTAAHAASFSFSTCSSSFPTTTTTTTSSSIDSDMQFLITNKQATTTPTQRPKLRRNITSGVGTRTYAAPEQLAIPSIPYDEKADIYSLGIILFELYQPFSTAMERAESMDRLKTRGEFPPHFKKEYPIQASVIQSMMHPHPHLRPTALQLLDHALFRPFVKRDHDREMNEMRHQYDQIKHENEDLQRRLIELQSKLDDCQMYENKNKRLHTKQEEQECDMIHGHSKKIELDHSILSKIISSSSNSNE